MAAGSAAEAFEAGEIPILKGSEEDGLSQQVVPKYLIGKTQEEMEEIVLSFGEVSFLIFLFMCYPDTLIHGSGVHVEGAVKFCQLVKSWLEKSRALSLQLFRGQFFSFILFTLVEVTLALILIIFLSSKFTR